MEEANYRYFAANLEQARVDQALGALRSGQRAVVAPADAEKVLENLRAGMV